MTRILLRPLLACLSLALLAQLAPIAAHAEEGEKIQAGETCIYYAIVDDESNVLKYHVYNECGKPVKVTIEVRPADHSEGSADCDATVVVDLSSVQDAYAELPCPEGSNYKPNVFYEEL